MGGSGGAWGRRRWLEASRGRGGAAAAPRGGGRRPEAEPAESARGARGKKPEATVGRAQVGRATEGGRGRGWAGGASRAVGGAVGEEAAP